MNSPYQVDETSIEKVKRYIARATDDHTHQNMGRRNTTGDVQKEFARKEDKRKRGISTAFDRLDRMKPVSEADAKATPCGRCGTTHVPPSKGGKCPALKEAVSPKEQERNVEMYGKRAATLLKHHSDTYEKSQQQKKAGDTETAAKTQATSTRAHKLFLKARNKFQEHPDNREAHTKRMMSGASEYYKSKKPGEYTGDSFDPTLTNSNPYIGEEVVEAATPVAIRMQRALDKIKADRERKERLAAPYVQSVFKKKEDEKSVKEQTNIDEFLPAAMAALGRIGMAAGRAGGRALAGLGGAAVRTGSRALAGLGVVGGIAKGIGSAIGSGTQSGDTQPDDSSSASDKDNGKKKKTTVSNLDYVKESLVNNMRQERLARRQKINAHKAREAASKPVSFQSYIKPKGNTNEETN